MKRKACICTLTLFLMFGMAAPAVQPALASEAIEIETEIVEVETETKTEESETAADEDGLVYATANVNVRTGHGTDNSIVGTLTYAESVKLIEEGDDGWDKVE